MQLVTKTKIIWKYKSSVVFLLQSEHKCDVVWANIQQSSFRNPSKSHSRSIYCFQGKIPNFHIDNFNFVTTINYPKFSTKNLKVRILSIKSTFFDHLIH